MKYSLSAEKTVYYNYLGKIRAKIKPLMVVKNG
jgi:hypothetical protein